MIRQKKSISGLGKMPWMLLLIFNCLIFSTAFAQQGENKTDEKGRKQGVWIKIDPRTGKKIYKGQFKDDKPVGRFYYYDLHTDSVKTILDFRGEGKIAYATMFHYTGKMQAKGKYIQEQKDSIWNFYDDKGFLLSTENYKMGKKYGKSIVYFPEGKISEEKMFRNDTLDGPFKQYYSDGKTKGEGAYKKNEFTGKCTYYYPDGEIAATGVYDDKGRKKGVWLYKTAEGKIQSREVWENGRILSGKELEAYDKKMKEKSEANQGKGSSEKGGDKPKTEVKNQKPKAKGKGK